MCPVLPHENHLNCLSNVEKRCKQPLGLVFGNQNINNRLPTFGGVTSNVYSTMRLK